MIKEMTPILDIVAIDESLFLIASFEGLFKTTKEKMVAHYFQ
jgi:hypothetical protein